MGTVTNAPLGLSLGVELHTGGDGALKGPLSTGNLIHVGDGGFGGLPAVAV